MKPFFAFAATMLAAAACAGAPDAPASRPAGDILHYIRSNTDGSMPESISVYQVSETDVAVFKRVAPCTPAALVTGRFDLASGEAVSLVGGRLAHDGTQAAFAWLKHDPSTDMIAVNFEGSDGAPVETGQLPGTGPWRLYDFDFADFNALARPPVAGETRRYDLAMIWPAGEPGKDQVRIPGPLTATWQGRVRAAEDAAARYVLSGAGLDGGTLDLDIRDGTVVEVRTPAPNHPGYTDYLLRRTGRDRGADAWMALLAAHWSDCAEISSD